MEEETDVKRERGRHSNQTDSISDTRTTASRAIAQEVRHTGWAPLPTSFASDTLLRSLTALAQLLERSRQRERQHCMFLYGERKNELILLSNSYSCFMLFRLSHCNTPQVSTSASSFSASAKRQVATVSQRAIMSVHGACSFGLG